MPDTIKGDANRAQLSCPTCSAKLTYLGTNDQVGLYNCPNDGLVMHFPDGRVQVVVHSN